MNRSTLLALLIGLLLAGGVYLLLHKEPHELVEPPPPPPVDNSPIARLLRDTEGLVPPAYDEAAMRKLAENAGARMTPAQERIVLPLLHRHALALRKNLEGARDVLAQDPDADLSLYVMVSSQAHAHFQRTVRETVSDETARALFDAVPPMVPTLPADEPATAPSEGSGTGSPETK